MIRLIHWETWNQNGETHSSSNEISEWNWLSTDIREREGTLFTLVRYEVRQSTIVTLLVVLWYPGKVMAVSKVVVLTVTVTAVDEFFRSGSRVLSVIKMRWESSSWTPTTRAFIGSLHLTYSNLPQGASQQCLNGRSFQTARTAPAFHRPNSKQSKENFREKTSTSLSIRFCVDSMSI